MKKETRANLLFLGIFLAISLPGGVILFKKKLDPSVRPSYLPPAAPTRVVYVDPREAPDLKRYVPPLTGRWVRQEAAARGIENVLSHDGLPVMSAGHTVQVIAATPGHGELKISLLIWIPVEVASIANRSLENIASADLPADVRRELIVAGFANPPKQVVWANASIPIGTAESGASRTLPVLIDGHSDTVTIFTK